MLECETTIKVDAEVLHYQFEWNFVSLDEVARVKVKSSPLCMRCMYCFLPIEIDAIDYGPLMKLIYALL